ncbi:MAG: PfkB family carbohydrate kinase [Elusimicrobiota bacterium]
MNGKNKVLVVGSVALDDIETPFGSRDASLGGSAVFFSWACSLFSEVSMVGVVGDDFPAEYTDDMNRRGIDTNGLVVKEGKTFHWKGRYDFDCNIAHTIQTDLNVFGDFSPELLGYQKDIPYLFLANIDPVIQLRVAKEMKNPSVIATDTMNYWIESKRDDLMKVLEITDFLLVNDAEARQLAEEANLVTAAKKILTWGPKTIIVKQGEYGVTMFYSSGGAPKIETFSAPSIPLETVTDPTGAGDSFAGGFIGYLAMNGSISDETIRRAVVMGSVVASFTVEGFSIDVLRKAQKEEIHKRFSKLRKISYFEDIEEGLV